MQLYDITIAANSSRRLDAPGTYFYYYTGNAGGADSTITLQGISSGLRIVLKPGQSLRLPQGANVETSWLVGNYANAATIVGTVIVGTGEIQDNRITGSVEVIDGGKARTLAGGAFMGANYQPAVAAQYSTCQLWNAAGNTKNAIVENIWVSSATAQILKVGWNTAANGGALNTCIAKRAGAANSVAQNNVITLAGNPTGFQYLAQIQVQANAPFAISLKEPVALPPGYGLSVQATTANTDLNTSFEFFEESTV
jgi:hypothetical protein